MQFRLLSTSLLAIVSLAAATTTVTVTAPPAGQTPTPASQCNTGALWCCNNVQAANSGALSLIWGLLSVVVSPVTALVGSACSPIDLLAVGGNSCTAQPVCCQNNNFSGLVVIGCSPVNLNL